MSAEILSTHTPALFRAAVNRAAELLRAGEVVALPTETVYGLAANALDEKAVANIFQIKGRPAHNPIIVHVASIELAKRCARHWPALAEKLAAAFWPGPLTIVLQKSGVRGPRSEIGSSETSRENPNSDFRPPTSRFAIPDLVTAGGDTVGIRWPSHPFIQAVIRECGFPLAAPSANLSNRISPTSAEHVRKDLGEKISLIVDGGQSQVGIESTVLDVTATPPRVLRPGMIHEESLAAVCGEVAGDEWRATRTEIRRSPGLLQKHYSPKAKLLVLHWQNGADLDSQLVTRHPPSVTCHIIAHTRIPSPEKFARVSVIPHDAEAFARAIYSELHRCDELGAELIVVEEPPGTAEWRAIADRLKRASAN